MATLILKAEKRDVLGKKTRFLRRQGITPVHLFGHAIASQALQCDTTDVQLIIAQGGTTRLIDIDLGENQPRSAFIREIQRDSITGELLHVDFYQVKKTEKITADVPIVLVGKAPAARSKDNMIEHELTEIGVECLPDRLPPEIEVDLSRLEEAGQTIHVRDIVIGPDIAVTTDPDQIIVKVSRIKMAVEEAIAVEEEAAPVEAAQAEKPAGEEAGG